MTILQRHPRLVAALEGEMTPKFLATRSAAGTPNVVPVTSILPVRDGNDTIFFGNFLLRKTIVNLGQDRRAAVLVITDSLDGWRLTCDFARFETHGPCADRQSNSPLLRYNAYTGIRDAGLLDVNAVDEEFSMSRLSLAAAFLATRCCRAPADCGLTIPLAARREWGRFKAVKVVAWIGEDGYPDIAPALTLQPGSEGTLVCWMDTRLRGGPRSGAEVAANVLTMDAISYQVKGVWEARGVTGAIRVREVYAGGPPLPGGRIA
ncbi:MAG: pyridoxamine 5'-phosphate oxidase family protein [Candidatus Riflebacteria bacterium]|nr:pyridoxamine 5'-phosphate oxidase family protein [Candidatus Riflebacteria bacterium]